MKIATWNVNSLLVRLPQVTDWLVQHRPTVLALQETKLVDARFPLEAITSLGYHAVYSGQPTYNGVAILSRSPLSEVITCWPDWDDPQCRLLAATIDNVRIVNVYVPNGSTLESDKYQYKLRWLSALISFLEKELIQYPELVLLGDFNIAPQDIDVYDPQKWAGQVLVSEPERAYFNQLLALGLWDAFRLHHDASGAYTWWDYRMMAFRRKQGLRIDHLLISHALKARCQGCEIDVAPRRHERPSDHAPVFVNLFP
jgi:exodeoxyribonuclease III